MPWKSSYFSLEIIVARKINEAFNPAITDSSLDFHFPDLNQRLQKIRYIFSHPYFASSNVWTEVNRSSTYLSFRNIWAKRISFRILKQPDASTESPRRKWQEGSDSCPACNCVQFKNLYDFYNPYHFLQSRLFGAIIKSFNDKPVDVDEEALNTIDNFVVVMNSFKTPVAQFFVFSYEVGMHIP